MSGNSAVMDARGRPRHRRRLGRPTTKCFTKKSSSQVSFSTSNAIAVGNVLVRRQLAPAALDGGDELDRLAVERRVLETGAAPRWACSVTSPRSCSSRMPRSSAWPRIGRDRHRHLREQARHVHEGQRVERERRGVQREDERPAVARQHAVVAAVRRVTGERQHACARRRRGPCDPGSRDGVWKGAIRRRLQGRHGAHSLRGPPPARVERRHQQVADDLTRARHAARFPRDDQRARRASAGTAARRPRRTRRGRRRLPRGHHPTGPIAIRAHPGDDGAQLR